MSQGPETLRRVVGENVARMRQESALRQQDLAIELQARGLSWTRSNVAAAERGERAVSLETLLILANALSSGERIVALADLVAGAGSVQVSDLIQMPKSSVRDALRGGEVKISTASGDVAGTLESAKVAVGRVRQALRQTSLLKTMTVAEMRVIRQWVQGESEQRAAKQLGIQPVEMQLLAYRLWGQPLDDERDARVGHPEGKSSASLRAMRGRVTRTLLTEAREYLAARLSE